MDSINNQLQHVECPMNWYLTDLRESVKVDRIIERMKESLEEDSIGQTWRTLTKLLFLSFELYMAQNSTFDFTYFHRSEEIIEKDCWMQKYCSAAKHVLYGMHAYSMFKMNSQRSVFFLQKIKLYQDMTNEEKAFILAVKSSFYCMYGPPGNSAALKIISEVVVLDPNEPEWWFLKGKCLARIRRLYYRSRPTAEEISSFNKAVQMEGNSSGYLIHLARSKADLSSYLIHNKTSVNDFKVIEALNMDVESLLRKAVSLRVNSSHLICHIAKSFMKLPNYFRVRNCNLTKFCVLQALRKSPTDPMVNHTAGLFCLKQDDVGSAVYFLTEASNMGVHGASFDLCRLKWTECRKYDPVSDLTELIEKSDKYACSEAHGLLATYYFFVKNDLPSTIVHWKKWDHSRNQGSYLITSVFLGQESFDFNSALYDEVRLESNSTSYNIAEDRVWLNEVVNIIEENRPELKLQKPRRQRQYLIDKAQMVSKIGRAYPDSIGFMLYEQRELMKKGRGKDGTHINEKEGTQKKIAKEVKKEIGKKGKENISSKYNAYRRGKKDEKNYDDRKEQTRSQSASSQEYGRRSFETPFWRPRMRHRSMDCLNKGGDTRSEADEKSVGLGIDKRINAGTSNKPKRNVGSGRIRPDNSKCNILQVKAASMESLLLVKSYDPKKSFHRHDQYNKGSQNNLRSSSQESLLPNQSTGREFSKKQTFGSIGMNSDKAESKAQDTNSRGISGVRPMRQPSISKDIQTSTQSENRNWRQNKDSGVDLASPKSNYFLSFRTTDQCQRHSSQEGRVKSSPHTCSDNQERSRDSRVSRVSHSSAARHEDALTRSGGKDEYVPRGRGYSRGGQRAFQRRNISFHEAERSFHDSFRRLDLGKK